MSDRPEVSLRAFQEGDAPAVHRWFNNPEATKSLMEQRGSFSLEEAEGWTRRAMKADEGEDRKYAIVVEGYDEPVGFTALYGLFRQTAPELGALIGDEVRRSGVGRRTAVGEQLRPGRQRMSAAAARNSSGSTAQISRSKRSPPRSSWSSRVST